MCKCGICFSFAIDLLPMKIYFFVQCVFVLCFENALASYVLELKSALCLRERMFHNGQTFAPMKWRIRGELSPRMTWRRIRGLGRSIINTTIAMMKMCQAEINTEHDM